MYVFAVGDHRPNRVRSAECAFNFNEVCPAVICDGLGAMSHNEQLSLFNDG